jgi:hypothetical protein
VAPYRNLLKKATVPRILVQRRTLAKKKGQAAEACPWSFYIYQEIWRSIILNFRIWARPEDI